MNELDFIGFGIGVVFVIAVFAYLAYALIHPEKF